MKVSVVVPAYNEAAGLAASLASIRDAMAAFDEAGWAPELIVCDNNSTDRTAEIARQTGAAVVFEPINQISRARTTGAAHASGDWLVFVDADSHPSRALFADVAAAIRRGRCLGGGSVIRLDTDALAPRLVGASWNVISRTFRWAAGSFMFCETDAFRALGGFSLELYAAEEIEFFRRLKRLARRRGRSVEILRANPLLTSARKAYLYTPREALAFMLKTVTQRGRTLKNPQDCYQWYDGRR